MPRFLYLHPGPVPPPSNERLDKFFYLSEILEGDVLLPSWWKDAESADPATFPVRRIGRFTYHMIAVGRLSGLRLSLARLKFFVGKGLELHRQQPFDTIMVYGTNMPGIAGVVLKLLTGAKLIPELPNVPEHQYRYTEPVFGLTARIKKFLADLLLHVVVGAADRVKVLYPDQLLAYPLLKNRPRTVCHDLVPVNYISSDLANGGTGDGNVLVLGFPWFTKGIDIAIQAFREIAPKFPGYRLVIVGQGVQTEYLQSLAAGCEQIELRKPVPHPEALRLIASCSVYLSASRTEGIARVLLEAMAAARPVVASAVGGTPFLVRDGQDGLLFRCGDVKDLSRQLQRILSDEGLRSRLSAAAKERVHTCFDEKAYIREFAKLTDFVVTP